MSDPKEHVSDPLNHVTPPELPTVTADRWEPLDPTERSRARTRLEAIRTALKETPQ